MSSVLARVRRGLQVVTFHRAGRRRFRDHAEAVAFLRGLASDSMAVSAMRRALMDVHPIASISTLSTAEVLSALARHVLDGTILLEVSNGPMRGPLADVLGNIGNTVPAVPAQATQPKPPAAPKSPPAPEAPPKLDVAAALAAVIPAVVAAVKELVETVQIEAVDVRIEVEQAMALIDMAQVRFDLGTASLQEIPASIDQVMTSMREVSSKTLRTIDEL